MDTQYNIYIGVPLNPATVLGPQVGLKAYDLLRQADEIAAHQFPGFTRLTGIGGWHDSTDKLFYEPCLVYQVILPAPLHDIGTPWSITTFASALATLFDQQEVLVTSTPIKTIRVHGFKKEI